MPTTYIIDALLPAEMASKAEETGVRKANMSALTMFVLAVLAGAFIALGAIFFTITVIGDLPFGLKRLLGGITFCLGLILVIIGGAELFTGNNLIVMAWASGRISVLQILRNWVIVYCGNLAGSLATAVLMYFTGQYTFAEGQVGMTALAIAQAKCSLTFVQATTLGIMCNVLVCLAVWLCFSARTTTDKILSIIFPITAFVAAGFEHCVANMYFIPIGLFIRSGADSSFWQLTGTRAEMYPDLTISHFLLNNLVPVTIGNIIGGTIMVGAVYWFVYLRQASGDNSSQVAD
jgi:formate transporter FocA